MRKLAQIICFIICLTPFINLYGEKWSQHFVIFDDGSLKVEVQVKIMPNSCDTNDRPNRYRYTVTGKGVSNQQINWDLYYRDCNGKETNQSMLFELPNDYKEGLIESMYFTFKCKDFIRTTNKNPRNNNEKAKETELINESINK